MYSFRDNWDASAREFDANPYRSLSIRQSRYEHWHGTERTIIFDDLRSSTSRQSRSNHFGNAYLEFLHIKASSGLKDRSDLQQVRRTIDVRFDSARPQGIA